MMEITRVRGLATLGLFLLASGCQGPRWKQRIVYRRSPVAIYLEKEMEEGQVVPHRFAHPASLPPAEMAGLLGKLRHRSWEILHGKTVEPVFEESEVLALAGPLSEALGKAQPDERVRFLVARTLFRPVFLGPKGTSGVVFLSSPTELDLAFDLIQETLPDEGGDPRAMVFREDPVKIVARSPELESPVGSLRSGAPEGKVYPRWLVVDPRALPALAAPPPAAAPSPAASASAGAASAAPSPAAPPGTDSRVDQEAEAIRRRLQVLERLKSDGAISQEEYEKARYQVLLQSER